MPLRLLTQVNRKTNQGCYPLPSFFSLASRKALENRKHNSESPSFLNVADFKSATFASSRISTGVSIRIIISCTVN